MGSNRIVGLCPLECLAILPPKPNRDSAHWCHCCMADGIRLALVRSKASVAVVVSLIGGEDTGSPSATPSPMQQKTNGEVTPASFALMQRLN